MDRCRPYSHHVHVFTKHEGKYKLITGEKKESKLPEYGFKEQ